jgi:hypothetical protein
MPRRSGRIFGEDFGEDFRGREAGKKAGAGGTGQDEPQARTERDKADESGRDRAAAGPTEAGQAWKRVRKREGEKENEENGGDAKKRKDWKKLENRTGVCREDGAEERGGNAIRR